MLEVQSTQMRDIRVGLSVPKTITLLMQLHPGPKQQQVGCLVMHAPCHSRSKQILPVYLPQCLSQLSPREVGHRVCGQLRVVS